MDIEMKLNSNIYHNNQTLKTILLEYFLYLINNDFESDKSFDFIFYILDSLNITSKYLKKISLDTSLKSNGIFIPEDKSIVLNLNPIKRCIQFQFISKKEGILSYFNLLLHEISHVIQKYYKENSCDEISEILRLAENLKFLSNNDYSLYSFFSDEVQANISAASFLYDIGKSNVFDDHLSYLEKSYIYYLTLDLIKPEYVINSQLKYLYKTILGLDYDEHYNSLNEQDRICLGLTKSKQIMDALINSYQTQMLCIDINMEGGFGNEQRNKQRKLRGFYE